VTFRFRAVQAARARAQLLSRHRIDANDVQPRLRWMGSPPVAEIVVADSHPADAVAMEQTVP
jgi:hypothetical protein